MDSFTTNVQFHINSIVFRNIFIKLVNYDLRIKLKYHRYQHTSKRQTSIRKSAGHVIILIYQSDVAPFVIYRLGRVGSNP